MKKLSLFVFWAIAVALLAGCGGRNVKEPHIPTNDIVILYTNDTHTYIDNASTDAEGNVVKGLSFASVKALKDELTAMGNSVLLVDAGDHVQGTAFGSTDEGESIINIMNATGYDAATLGNHEFDYGMFRTFALMGQAGFPYLSCNFYTVSDKKTVVEPYKIFDIAGVKIAIVGISTPESITSSTPTYFMDETGSNYIYNFYSGSDGKEMYDSFQKAVNKARKEADYVIGLGHLGTDISSAPYRSTDLIANITGIDAFIDGHSHTSIASKLIPDAKGNNVILTQTGCYFDAIGKMVLCTDGSIRTELVTSVGSRDSFVDSLADKLVDNVNSVLGEKIAALTTPMWISDPESGARLIRRSETNLGDFVADATYYYFNNVAGEPVDITLANGGGIRANVEIGDCSYLSAKAVAPFGNIMCVIEATGQQILDALELGAALIGAVNPESGKPAEFGGFQHVAGMKYTIDTGIPSTVSVDDAGIWLKGPESNYRVCDVYVYNRLTGTYEALDLAKTYRIGGINYTLRNQGDGMSMFKDCKCVVDYVNQDYLVLAEYMKSFAQIDGIPTISTANSPLSSCKGYLIDYESTYGSGRITIK